MDERRPYKGGGRARYNQMNMIIIVRVKEKKENRLVTKYEEIEEENDPLDMHKKVERPLAL